MYIRKQFESKWLFGALRFSIISEDRENGEYKHVIDLSLFKKKLMSIVFRTGNDGTAMGFFYRMSKSHSFLDAVFEKRVRAKEGHFGNTEFIYEPTDKSFKQILVIDDEAKKNLYYEDLKKVSPS